MQRTGIISKDLNTAGCPCAANGEYVSAASVRRRAKRSEKTRQKDVERVKHLTQDQLKQARLDGDALRPSAHH